ncbi:hypothetical protein FRC11_001408, partial [Ceratobasidium sp. 423]
MSDPIQEPEPTLQSLYEDNQTLQGLIHQLRGYIETSDVTQNSPRYFVPRPGTLTISWIPAPTPAPTGVPANSPGILPLTGLKEFPCLRVLPTP